MEHHGEALREVSECDSEQITEIAGNYEQADVSTEDRAMLDYVEKLTKDPEGVSKEDIEKMRAVGFSDRDILDINQVAAYFSYVNRTAEGLGVELE